MSPAVSLASWLRQQGLQGITCVGETTRPPGIIVYVVRVTPQLRSAIPANWEGVPVTMKRSGVIRPA